LEVAESDVIFTPPSTALTFVTKMSDECKYASPSAVQVKNWQKTISTEEKLDVIRQLEKGYRIIDICHNVTFADSRVRAICANADRITEFAKSGTEVFV